MTKTNNPIDFCTLGMFVIDEIHFQPPTPPVFDVLGGAGTFAALGARMLSPPPSSKSIGWIVDAGNDFPPELRQVIASWQTSCLIREDPTRLTTRGWNGYSENEHRAFKYTTQKLRLDHTSLSEELLTAKCFHFICASGRCMDLVQGILERRSLAKLDRSLFVWEPVPDMCVPDELDRCLDALKHVDVVSPNHGELCSFYGKEAHVASGEVNKPAIEESCKQWLKSGVGPDGTGAIAVRAGAAGCLLATKERSVWMPAYHQNSSKVIDPTGGGNTFLGGLGLCLARGVTSNGLTLYEEAVAWGSVAASFAIEQVGMPKLASSDCHTELWNSESAEKRLAEYKLRLQT